MAKIGNWGNIIKFHTSDNRILTFDGFKRKASARIKKHNIINGRPKIEFLGPDLQSISFTIELNALLGVEPRRIENKLLRKLRTGRVAPLVIGGKKICSKVMLTGMSDAYNIILRKGEVLSMTIDVTMTEYR